jgi:hypothetical protein
MAHQQVQNMMFVAVYMEILGREYLACPAQLYFLCILYSYVRCNVHVVSHNWSSVVAFTTPSVVFLDIFCVLAWLLLLL